MEKIQKNRTFVCLLAMALCICQSIPAVANTDCPGDNDAYGPCSDTGEFETSGGNGWCGACTAELAVYIGGSCSGGTNGTGAFDCNDCTTAWKTKSTPYASTAVGAIAAAACYVANAACLALPAAGCAALCLELGPVGAAACAAACESFASGPCDCMLQDCLTSCAPSGAAPTYTGSTSACN